MGTIIPLSWVAIAWYNNNGTIIYNGTILVDPRVTPVLYHYVVVMSEVDYYYYYFL